MTDRLATSPLGARARFVREAERVSSTTAPTATAPYANNGGPRVDVSVLVPVLNEEAHLDDAIAHMVTQRIDRPVEFLCIDGGSDDRSLAIIRQWAARDGRIRLLANPARRTPTALNIGLRHARGHFVARMDAHTRYPDRYLAIGVERLLKGDVVSVGGPQVAVGDGRWSRRVALALTTAMGCGGARFRRAAPKEFDVDSGFTGLWWKATLQAHGGWDEAWLNDQDFELAARLRQAGGRIVCIPDMAAEYVPRDSLRALAAQYWRYGFYRVKTSRRHPESMRRSHVLPPGLAAASAAAIAGPRLIVRPARAGIALYVLVLLATSARASRDAPLRDAVALPAVFVMMHMSYGIGFLTGCARFGVPMAALSRILRPGRRERRSSDGPRLVEAGRGVRRRVIAVGATSHVRHSRV